MAIEAAAAARFLGAAGSVFSGVSSSREARRANDRADRLARYQEAALERSKQRAESIEPCIRAWLADACNRPKPENRYAEINARVQAQIKAQSAAAIRKLQRCASQYCAPVTCSQISSINMQAAALSVEAMTAELRREEARLRILEQQDRAAKAEAIKFAEGVYQESRNAATALLAYYERQVTNANNNLAGSLRTLGYLTQRDFRTARPGTMPAGFNGLDLPPPETSNSYWDKPAPSERDVMEDLFGQAASDRSAVSGVE